VDELGPIPWPEPSDSFLALPSDWRATANLGSVAGDWDAYIIGYKRGADMFATATIEAGTHSEFLVFPVLFLNHHYVELQLKRLLFEGRALLDQDPAYDQIHDLKALWADCKPLLERVFPESTPGDTAVVTRLIDELHSLDPGSLAFRYPVGKSGKPTIPPQVPSLDIRNIRTVMVKLESFFDGAATGISVYLDTKHDMEDAFTS